VGDDSVRLEVTLPWLPHKFGEAEQKIIAGPGQIEEIGRPLSASSRKKT
jgi:hypothetical protein